MLVGLRFHLQAGEELVGVLVLPDVDGRAVVITECAPEAAGVDGLVLPQRQVPKYGLRMYRSTGGAMLQCL